MAQTFDNEPMLEIYIFETTMFLDQMEQLIINSEKVGTFGDEAINEIFRFMHTIKGSSAMMLFNNIANIAHQMEDVFYFIRENKPEVIDYSSLSDLVLSGVDFIKVEINKIKNSDPADGDSETIVEQFKDYLVLLKMNNNLTSEIKKTVTDKVVQYYIPQEKKSKEHDYKRFRATIHFEAGCEMENIRAYTVVFGLTEHVEEMIYKPSDITENEETSKWIQENGFEMLIKTKMSMDELKKQLSEAIFLKESIVEEISEETYSHLLTPTEVASKTENNAIKMPTFESDSKEQVSNTTSAMISVHVDKLDKLMNMVGELVIAEAMVTQNPIVATLDSDTFQKASRLLHKITGELQDTVMSIRMVPLSTTFVKMHRIVRDMCKKLNKEVSLELYGEETEVDKNIIEHISDPLMHLIRNAIDHGIETEEERYVSGKAKIGTISLGAKNAGGDVLIIIKDDGKGLSREKIYKKATENGLVYKPQSEMSDREIFNLILLPGFSTKDSVTEFSGRGVGMDVVSKNLEAVGGVVIVESEEGAGTTITLKIPLTLAIIEGMNIKVGESRYTIPITSIKESFRPNIKDCIMDPDKNEMVMVRGECYPIIRLHERFKVKNAISQFNEGILIMVEQDEKVICIFADELLGQQQVVVKSLPHYINSIKKIVGLAGCTLLGDGNISLILDISGLTALRIR
jgi:two-component system chemotaxis sensor kinase CheA